MSELKLISPLLDNFEVGGAISEHNGVRCYPAMRKDSDSKYIIKTISIPASQTQLDALLLTGAYSSEDAALAYFKELADSTAKEYEILQHLSKLDGFLAYEGCQTVPMEDRIGYDVYLLSSYRRTLEKHFQRQPMTYLSAINLGLDLCTALSVCRRAGYLYVDLKPSNIYVTEDRGYRIGDLGFIHMSSLKYASLPAKYRSAYTAPEVTDAFSALNATLDIYAAGLILYQAYNGGELPVLNEEKFSAPMYADYEMAEIILKACDPDPEKRWQDPVEMGQALVGYMQRNGANDIPIVPPAVPTVLEPALAEAAFEKDTYGDEAVTAEITAPEYAAEIPGVEEVAAEADMQVQTTAESVYDEDTSTSTEEDQPVKISEGLDDPSADIEASGEDGTDEPQEDNFENLSFLDDLLSDETYPENTLETVEYSEISDEVSEILSHIDELAAHPVPDPVVAPEPVEIPMPEPIVIADEEPVGSEPDATLVIPEFAIDEGAFDHDASADDSPVAIKEYESDEESEYEEEAPDKKSKVGNWLRNILIFLSIAIVAVAGYLYYNHIYLLNIDSVSVDGDEINMVVYVDSQVDESLLSVVCSDSHGNQLSAPVVDGKATFANLAPDTAYNINVIVDGFHRLTGDISASYSTPAQTNVVQFNAVTGPESGSVILSFTVEGPDSGNWSVAYSAEGEEEKTVELLSHMVTLSGLTVGKEYTFTLVPSEGMYVTGMTQITFTASDLVYAEDLTILSCVDGNLTASWNAPDGVDVANWTVRCYDNADYNQTIITTDTTVVFEGINTDNSHTLEVTAAGMSVSERAYVSENPITITDFAVDTSNPSRITLTWNSSHDIPDDGWILMYSIDGSDAQGSVSSSSNSAVISPMVPDATYTFTLQASDGTDVLTGQLSCQTPEAVEFSGYGVSPAHMTYKMCRTPEESNWNRYDLSDSDYTTDFAVGEDISLLVKLSRRYAVYDDDITTLFVIRDESGKVVTHSHSTRTWDDMWNQYYCEMDIPKVPTTPGNYTVSIYFNGLYTATLEFTIH